MRCFRIRDESGEHLVAREGDLAYDLTAANGSVGSFRDLAAAASTTGGSTDAVTDRLLDRAATVGTATLDNARRPVDPDEVWAAGVTYAISERAHKAESGMPEMYLDVSEGDRPEILLEATARRTVRSGEAVGIREDPDWDVPEPELAVPLTGTSLVPTEAFTLREGDVVLVIRTTFASREIGRSIFLRSLRAWSIAQTAH